MFKLDMKMLFTICLLLLAPVCSFSYTFIAKGVCFFPFAACFDGFKVLENDY